LGAHGADGMWRRRNRLHDVVKTRS
jgi:hypothetical protein